MKKIITFVLFITSVASAEIIITPLKITFDEQNFTSSACSLKKMALLKQDFKATSTEDSGGSVRTGIYGFLETSDPSCQRQFAFVQYIKGCAIERTKTASGRWNSHYKTYQLRGREIDFNLPNWTVDTIDDDPMYASTDFATSSDRHYNYLTPKSPVVLSDKNKTKLLNYVHYSSNAYPLGLNQGPQREISYVSDYPSGANIFYFNGLPSLQYDAVLDFKLCVYKSTDVPRSGNPQNFDVPEAQGGPLGCIDWSSNHIYDRISRKFTESTDIKSFCQNLKSTDYLSVRIHNK